MKVLVGLVGLALIVTLLLFDVDLNVEMQWPEQSESVDPEQEARYEACVEEADHRVHSETFAAIDNPDVQREILYRRMQDEKVACRAEWPERTVTAEQPFRFNLVDLTWRY